MSAAALKSAVTGKDAEGAKERPIVKFERVLETFLPQLQRALPAHLKPDRMARLALSAFQTTAHLDECEGRSVLASLMTAGTLGLEPGVNGQGWLIPYFDTKRRMYICTFVPGWKGMLDLVSRSGRASAWTGAVFKGDHFDYDLGDRPFVKHRPGDGGSGELSDLTHVYAIGRVNGADWPVVEVWPIAKVNRHRDKYNRQGERHYAFREPEMYARKVPLLQVLKYLPSSIEIAAAIELAERVDTGRIAHLDASGLIDLTSAGPDDDGVVSAPPPPARPLLDDKPSGEVLETGGVISGETFATREAAGAASAKPKGKQREMPAPATDPAATKTAAPDGDPRSTSRELVQEYMDKVKAAKTLEQATEYLDEARSVLTLEALQPVAAAYKARTAR